MSRAFVDEDAGQDRGIEAPEIKIPIPPGSRNYVTPEGAEALRASLRRLVAEERPSLSAAIARIASEAGDPTAGEPRAEELAALRQRLGALDRRGQYLERMTAIMEVVERREPGTGRVVFGSRVLVREEGAERDYRIVGVDESDPERGLLSWTSPVARALTGKRIGERAVVALPGGDKTLEVLDIV